MDFLDSDEEDSPSQGTSISHEKVISSATNSIFISLVKLKPIQKPRAGKTLNIDNTTPIIDTSKVVLTRKLYAVGHKAVEAQLLPFVQRLRLAKFDVTHLDAESFLSTHNDSLRADILIYITTNEDKSELLSSIETFYSALLPGGMLFLGVPTSLATASLFDAYYWNTEEMQSTPIESSMTVLTLKRRCVLCNETAVVYWTNNVERLARERHLLEQVSIPVSNAEYETGILSEPNHQKAVQALTGCGVVIFPQLFSRDKARQWGQAAITDMQEVIARIREKKNVDLLNPYVDKEKLQEKEQEPIMENFFELSMREALRCDIRNVPHLRQIHDSYAYELSDEWPAYKPVRDASAPIELLVDNIEKAPPCENVRFHPSILSVLHESMNPPNTTPGNEQGNWGAWNFERPGPSAPVSMKVGVPGTIFSFPGCSDQTIHADAPHLFVHETLPPHYVDLFVVTAENTLQHNLTREVTFEAADENEALLHANKAPGTLRGFPMGMTAFVAGSQELGLTREIMTGDEGQPLLEDRLIRPQLTQGDALLFDCRVLHFGLANQLLEHKDNTDSWRPLLYVNYHHTWFHDPKNWNDKEKLFS